ncbi:MAG TPA: glycosyltransferase, partial [Geobacterales bacterium]|nr:glycosyltransferase [Geobacterales bacterium]
DLPLVVYLGVLSTYQGIDLLLQAILELTKRQVPGHFLIMGFPEERYQEKALQMGLGDRVTFTGRIPYTEAPRYLAVGDLAVSPKLSATEANGKLLNYLACGLPTVAFDSPVNRELLGDAALYAAERNPQALAQALEKLLTDPELRRRISLQARERAVNVHSWLVRIKQLEKLYDTLLYPSTNRG